MSTIHLTLLQKPRKVSPEEFSKALTESLTRLKGNLSASAKLVGFTASGLAKLDLEGEDSEILGEIVSRELGQAPTNLSQIEVNDVCSSVVDHVGANVVVDIGIEKPVPRNVTIGPDAMRAQLCDGKLFPCKEIAERYCIDQNSKLAVRITSLGLSDNKIEAWLADSQTDLFYSWISSGLDRIQVFNCTRQHLEHALRRAGLERDVISVESDSLVTHSVVCKLGTDAIGLIPKLGPILGKIELKPFLPKRILAECRRW